MWDFNDKQLQFSLQVLSVIKWKGPTSNKLTSKFWKQMVYEMPAKQIEMPSRDQVNWLGLFFIMLVYYIYIYFKQLHVVEFYLAE